MKNKSWQYNYLSKEIRGLLLVLNSYLGATQIEEVEHFIDHGEYGEALRTLAWLIVEENKHVDLMIIQDIERMADAMAIREELPSELRHQAKKN